ncbi:2734_t:CDS:2 [Funneliformis geosporum]|nr:2734_t:CDS:2 [Funneliformis geosporum]
MASRDAEEHQGDLDPELLAKGIVDEESEIPPSEVVEWIPYERMINIRFFEEEMFIANWMDGYIVEWDYENNNWKRNGTGVEVLLKKIDESIVYAKFPGHFLHKVKSQFQLDTWDIIIKSYGITRDPYTGTYFMVMH